MSERRSVVLASFDPVPSAKGASAHVLANAAILSGSHRVSLVTLGSRALADYPHRPVHLRERNWLRRAFAFREHCEEIFGRYEFDIYHVRSPWEGLAVPAGKTLVYEVNGLYSIEAQYRYPGSSGRPAVRERLRLLERCLLDRAALVMTPSPTTAELLADLGVPPDRIEVVPNSPSIDVQPPTPGRRAGPVRLCYIGTLSPWQGLSALLPRLGQLREPFELSILSPTTGPARKAVVKTVRKAGIADRTTMLAPLPPEELGPFLAGQDIGLAPFVPCERNIVQGGMPIKLLDYAAAGLAVLAPDLPMVRHVYGDPYPYYRRWSRAHMLERLAQLVESSDARRDAAASAREQVNRRFGKSSQRKRLLESYERLT